MRPWWIRFAGRPSGCVLAEDAEDARCTAHEETGILPDDVQQLPLPAAPYLPDHRLWNGDYSPGQCARPDTCAGHDVCAAHHQNCPLRLIGSAR